MSQRPSRDSSPTPASFPAGQARHDEVTGVVAVDVGTSRTTCLPAVAARLQDETLVTGVVGDLTRDGVDEVLASVEADRVRAVVRLTGLSLERVDAPVRACTRRHRLDQLGGIATAWHATEASNPQYRRRGDFPLVACHWWTSAVTSGLLRTSADTSELREKLPRLPREPPSRRSSDRDTSDAQPSANRPGHIRRAEVVEP